MGHGTVGYDARASPLATIPGEVTGVLKASCSGAVWVEGVVHSLPPLPASPHLGPVAAKLLEEKDVDFICSDGLEQSSLERALGL